MISGRLDSIEERMEEILFRNWKRGRCRSFDVNVQLKSLYSVEGSNHKPFRFALRLQRVHGQGEIVIGCYSRINQLEKRADYEVVKFIYPDTNMFPQERGKFKIFPSGTRVVGQPFRSVNFCVAFGTESPLVSECGLDLNELGQYAIGFYCDSAWASQVDRVEIWCDDYLVLSNRNILCLDNWVKAF